MAAIGTLTIEMAANVARLQRDMDSARKSVDGAMAKITKAANLAKGALGALGAGLSVVGVSNFVKGVANAADEIGKMAQRTGVAAADLQKLKFAAEMSGVSVNSLGTALQIMSRNLQGATEESKSASKGFDALSINVKNADGSLKSTTQLMTEVANRFSRMEDGAQKTALAMQLFGRSGAELIPMLNEGEAGLRNMFKEAERLGIVMNDDLIKASTAFNDSLSQIQGELKGLMISAVAPFIQRLAEITTRFVEARQAGLSFFQSLVRGFTQTTIIEDLTTEISKLEKEISKLEGARRGPGMQRRGQIQEMNERLVVLRKNLEEAQAKLNEAPPALQKFTVAASESADELKRLGDIQRYYNQQTDEFFANEEKKRQALESSIRVGREMIEDLEFEAKALKMTNQEREIAIRLRKLEIAGIKEGSAAYEELAARIRDAVAGRDAIAEGIQQQRKLAEEWQKTTEEINRTLTDALMRAFEAGKGFGKAFKDTMVNLFRTMILRPILAPIVAGLTGGITPAMGADGGTTTLSIVSGLKTTYDMITKGFANIGATVSESLLRAGDYLATSSSDFLANSGTFLQNISQTAGTIASSVAAAAAGIALNTIISGGYSMGKGMDTFQKVGVAVASFINPVLGMVVGALTGVVNRLFGRKLADVGLEGTFGPEGFTGSRYEFLKGGVFRSNKTNRFGLEEELTMGFSAQFQSLRTATFLMAATLGEVSEDILGFTKNIKISFMGLTKDQIQERIAEEFENIANEMAVLIPNLLDFQRIGESSSETLQRLFNSANVANQAFDTLNYSFRVTTLATAEMASQLIDLFGGVERFGQVTEQFFMDFYSEAERTSTVTRQLTEALALLGFELPQTRQEYRLLAEAQDLTTEAGRKNYAVLLQLSSVFAGLTPTIDEFNASLAISEKVLQERRQLERQLLELQGKTNDLREIELNEIDASNRALLERIFLLRDEQRIAAERLSLERRLLQLQENVTALRNLELDSVDESNRALLAKIFALEDEKKAAEEAAKQINDTNGALRNFGNSLSELELAFQQVSFVFDDYKEKLQSTRAEITKYQSMIERGGDQLWMSLLLRTFDSDQVFEIMANRMDDVTKRYVDHLRDSVFPQMFDAHNQAIMTEIDRLKNIELGFEGILNWGDKIKDFLVPEIKIIEDEIINSFGDLPWYLEQELERLALVMKGDGQALVAVFNNLSTRLALAVQSGRTDIFDLENFNQSMDLIFSIAQKAKQQNVNNVLRERESLEVRLLQLQGNIVELRHRELMAIDESNRALLKQIFDYEDLQNNLSNAIKETDLAFSALERSIRKQQESINVTRRLAEEQISSIKSVFDVLNSSIQNLTQDGFTVASGRAFISQALKTAQQTGYLPDANELQRAISAVVSGLVPSQFASSFEMKKEQAIVVARLTQLRSFSQDQLTNAEKQLLNLDKQLESLENQLTVARDQINELRGINTGIKSIPEAILQLQNKLSEELRALQSLAKPEPVTPIVPKPTTPPPIVPPPIVPPPIGATSIVQSLFPFLSPEQRQFYLDLNETMPGFSAGGLHSGGMRLVGERGPELEVAGPARYMSNATLASMMNSGASEEIKNLREENKAQMRSLVSLQARMTRLLERWDGDGLPEERAVA